MLLADWDGSREKASWTTLQATKASLEQQGNRVTMMMPFAKDKAPQESCDFNDVLRDQGRSALKTLVQEQLTAPLTTQLTPDQGTRPDAHNRQSTLHADPAYHQMLQTFLEVDRRYQTYSVHDTCPQAKKERKALRAEKDQLACALYANKDAFDRLQDRTLAQHIKTQQAYAQSRQKSAMQTTKSHSLDL